MNRTRWIAAALAAVVSGGLVVGLALRGDDAPSTAAKLPATSNLEIPAANTASLKGSETLTLFNMLSLSRPKTWESTQGAPSVAPFADVVTCVGTADCPKIIFFNLATSEGKESSGDDPLKLWADVPCEGATLEAIEGPAKFTLDGEDAQFYRQKCGETAKYLWLVPGKQLLVTAYPGVGGGLSVEIVQAALESGKWM